MRPARRPVHLLDHRAQAVSDLISFQTQLVPPRHAPFGAPQLHDHLRTFQALDGAVHQLAHPVAVFGIHGVAFSLAHLLKDHLLRRLRGDSAQHLGRLGNLDFSLERGFRLQLPSLIERHLVIRVSHLFDDLLDCVYLDRARLLVEVRLQVLVALVVFPRGDQNRVFDRRNDDLRINALLAAQLIDRLV